MNIYKALNRITDTVTGYDIRKGKARAVSFDFLDRKQIDNYHQQKFRELAIIASTSEYYKNFRDKPIEAFPLIDREEYLHHMHQMRTGCKHPYTVSQSSGSTGKPVQQYISKAMLTAKRSSHQKMLSWYGLTRESPEFKLGGVQDNLKTKIYYYLRNKRYYNSFYISDQTLPGIVRHYNRFRPAVLYGYPSTINRFALFARENNLVLHHPRIIVTHAENLYKYIRENLSVAFPDSSIVNQYWSTEANIAETCPHGSLHIDEDTVICEVLDPDKNGIGDLYITNLFSYIVPIIRYKIGDRVKISDRICSCGRKTRVIELMEGRDSEYLILPDGRTYSITAIEEAEFAENILNYQLIHHKKENKIVFRYIPVRKELTIRKDLITSYFKNKFGLRTEFDMADKIETTSGGKLKRLIVID